MLVSFYKGEFRCRVEAVDREKEIESRAGGVSAKAGAEDE